MMRLIGDSAGGGTGLPTYGGTWEKAGAMRCDMLRSAGMGASSAPGSGNSINLPRHGLRRGPGQVLETLRTRGLQADVFFFFFFLFPVQGAGARARPFLFFTIVLSLSREPRESLFDGGTGRPSFRLETVAGVVFCGCGLVAAVAVRCGRYGSRWGLVSLFFLVLGGILFFSFLWLRLDAGGVGMWMAFMKGGGGAGLDAWTECLVVFLLWMCVWCVHIPEYPGGAECKEKKLCRVLCVMFDARAGVTWFTVSCTGD